MDIVERFLKYTTINTTTNRENGALGVMPSSPGQQVLAEHIKKELTDIGLEDIQLRSNAILTATLPENTNKTSPTIAFFAHLDTSAEQSNNTQAHIVRYENGDICLNEKEDIVLRLKDNPDLNKYIGQDIIVTDGTSLLGADDKAAIASIINALKYLKDNPDIKHGAVKVAFLPDEEQGLRGAKAFDNSCFKADFGYTLDCCGIGEFVCENWNAGNAVITFHGESAHPMSAKGKLKNSLLMAHKFIAMLPGGEAPEYTEKKEGYYWVKQLSGNSANTILQMDIRDFTEDGYKKRMHFLQQMTDACNTLWGKDTVDTVLSDRYQNVANYLQGNPYDPVALALQAYKENGIEPSIVPMRGGYDGAVLSQKGIPCPNLFTGGHNFHSIYEYLPVNSLKAASQVVTDIIRLAYSNHLAERV
ncbi:Peptidase T [invertebrate metagenome]|uniref:Peptidase T n=1 Tax=invertebrate metagenome TaxID=1711999 RepID=A0A2H9T646_9ZZZZ